MVQVRKLVPILTWDSCLITVRSQILECNLITREIKDFVSEAVNFILTQMESFTNLTRDMAYLRVPINYNFGCSCELVRQGQEKYVLVLTDSSPSKEDFLNPDKSKKFNYGFTSCIIYLVHKCQKTLKLEECLLSSYNKLSKPGYDILKTETQGPILACKRVLFLPNYLVFKMKMFYFLLIICHPCA